MVNKQSSEQALKVFQQRADIRPRFTLGGDLPEAGYNLNPVLAPRFLWLDGAVWMKPI